MSSKFSYIVTLSIGFVATSANATPNFPAALQSDLDLSAPPACALCHTDGSQGGIGTVNTPFGKNMRARGLVAYDTTSLSTALAAMESQNVDSAGSCLPDIQELKAGRDPNNASDLADCDGGAPVSASSEAPDVPGYGCGAQIAPRAKVDTVSDIWTFCGVAVLGLMLRRRRNSAVARALRVAPPPRTSAVQVLTSSDGDPRP